MITIKYAAIAYSGDGVCIRTYTTKTRRIYAKTRGHKTLSGTLRARYYLGNMLVGHNEAEFSSRNELMKLIAIFSENELVSGLE